MIDAGLWLAGHAALAVFALVGWAVSVPLRNVNIVDSLWSLAPARLSRLRPTYQRVL